MISVIILTFNESRNIARCLDSVAWCDNVVVIDSFSSDDTRDIAVSRGATVVTNRFENFAQQRNFAMTLPCVKYDWVFHLDADELITPQLQKEMFRVVLGTPHSGYHIPSRMMLFGRWLKRSAGYPVYQVRLVNRHEMRFLQHGHGQREDESRKGYGFLQEPYIHYSFSVGFDHWARKHNQYSTLEAGLEAAESPPPLQDLFRADAICRRRALRGLSRRLPGRPLVKFTYQYLLKGGFIEGKAGFTYCLLQSIYEYLIVLKVREHRLRLRGESP